MEITLDYLLQGKSTIIRNKKYLSTKEYVTPFIEEMKKYTDRFVVHVQTPNQLTLSNNNKDLTYNKVWIQAIMPNKCDIEGYHETYGLVYALDTRNPVYKIYRAYTNTTTNNMVVFDDQWIKLYELKPEEAPSYKVSDLLALENNVERKIKTMKNTFMSHDKVFETLGKLIEKTLLYEIVNEGGKIKLATNDIVKAYEDVYHNSRSDYYVSSTVEGSLHNYYSAIADKITNGKDIINHFEKTILIGMLFNLVKINEDSNRS